MTISLIPDAARLAAAPGPAYRALADLLAAAINEGRLGPGARLPPQRDLAHDLGVTVGTIGRAYGLLQARGLVSAEVGRGSYVRPRDPAGPGIGAVASRGRHDFRRNLPPDLGQGAMVDEALARIARGGLDPALLVYAPAGGPDAARRAGADHLAQDGFHPAPETVLVTQGAQQALVTALAVIARPGERVAVEAQSYPGVRDACRLLGIIPEPVALDPERGLEPEDLDRVAGRVALRGVVVVPNHQNPTGSIMDAARRARLGAVARARGLFVIEDDVYGPLVGDRPPPIAALAPERTLLVGSVSKCFAPGLRIGFLALPTHLVETAEAILSHQGLNVAPLMAVLAARLIAEGAVAAMARRVGAEMGARQALARRVLGLPPGPSQALHLHLPVRAPVRAGALADQCLRVGVDVYPPDLFALGDQPPSGLRLALGNAPDHATLEAGLGHIARALAAPAPGDALVI